MNEMDTQTTKNRRTNADFKWLRNDYLGADYTDYADFTIVISLIYKLLSGFLKSVKSA